MYGQQLCLGAHKLSRSPEVLKLDLSIELLKYHIIDACQKEIPIGRHRVCYRIIGACYHSFSAYISKCFGQQQLF